MDLTLKAIEVRWMGSKQKGVRELYLKGVPAQ